MNNNRAAKGDLVMNDRKRKTGRPGEGRTTPHVRRGAFVVLAVFCLIVAMGFVAYGVYCFSNSRYRRFRGM